MDRTHGGDTPGTAAPEEKRLATLTARAALAGVALIADSTPRYLVTRWGLTRELDSLDALERWLEQVAGERA